MKKISMVLATYNEEENISRCLESVKSLANEIVVVDGGSSDRTVEIARGYGARIFEADNPPIFHINKQKALEAAENEWILQLDADEVITSELANEIKMVIGMSNDELKKYETELPEKRLFLRHQRLVEERDGKVGSSKGEFAAFFIPRKNFFLGRFLRYGGVYPDGVIRLVKKGKALFPCKSVHEQIKVEGRVGWLVSPLLHYSTPNFRRYLKQLDKYTDLMKEEIKKFRKKEIEEKSGGVQLVGPSTGFLFVDYMMLKPVWWFLKTYFRHKGFLDSWQGFVFSLFSSLRFPLAFLKYIGEIGKRNSGS